MQLQLPQHDIESTLVINEGRVATKEEGISTIVLDLDLFREVLWNCEDDSEVWDLVSKFRARKNDVFEASISPLVRRQMQ